MIETITRSFSLFSSVSLVEKKESPFYDLYLVSFEGVPEWQKLKSHCQEIETQIGSSCRILIPMPGTTKVGIEIAKLGVDTQSLSNEAIGQLSLDGVTPLVLGINPSGDPLTFDLGYDEDVLLIGQDAIDLKTSLYSVLGNLCLLFPSTELRMFHLDANRMYGSEIISSLEMVLKEIEVRRKIFNSTRSRNIKDYNSQSQERIPRLVVALEELNKVPIDNQGRVLELIEEITLKNSALGIYVIVSLLSVGSNKEQRFYESKNIFSNILFNKTSADKSQYFLNCNDSEFLQFGGDMLFYDGTSSSRFHIFDLDEDTQKELTTRMDSWRFKDNRID